MMTVPRGRWLFADGAAWEFDATTRIMGILNVTPDSFSDGGAHLAVDAAVARGLAMADEGADIIDVGGESTRPGAAPVPAEEELRRVVPVIRRLRDRLDARGDARFAAKAPPAPEGSSAREKVGPGETVVSSGSPLEGPEHSHATARERVRSETDGSSAPVRLSARERVRISVDTSKAAVAEAALDAGAEIVNDVSGLRADDAMAPLLGARSAPVVLMHMRGTPATMQTLVSYGDLLGEVAEELRGSIAMARRAGVREERIVLDPGLGFSKTAEQNFEILASLGRLTALGRPLLVGASRKSFLGRATGLPVDQRLEASLAAGAAAVLGGASILRVHDVAATVRLVRILDAVRLASSLPR
jgi:dihydropteroate synthase